MAITFKDFLLDWYKAYHLANMDDGRKQRWADLRGKNFEVNADGKRVYLDDKRNGAQKGWGNPKTGELNTELPEPDLSDDDWERFYKICRDAIRNIDYRRKDLLRANPDNPLPIDKWFGDKDNKAFSPREVKPEIQDIFAQLANIIAGNQTLRDILKDNFTSSDYSIDTFIKDLKNKDYATNSQNVIPKMQMLVYKLPDLIKGVYDYEKGRYVSKLNPEVIQQIENAVFPKGKEDTDDYDDKLTDKWDEIAVELDPANERIDPVQLKQFKDPSVYKEILKALYASDKPEKKSPFHKQFSNAGGGEITGYMDESVSGNNYETGSNALTPKLTNQLNTFETIKEKIDDFKDEYLRRLTDRSARHIYVEENAKPIVDAIIKEKISPKDGLGKIMEKKDAIIKRASGKVPGCKKGCDFLFEALEYIKSSGSMDEALDGALRNGLKAEAVAFEIIKYAIQKHKVTEAKAALETLAVMRYDTFTSKHWEAFKGAQGIIFGDKDLSFNKNEGVAAVTGVIDKVIWTSVNGLFWGGVAIRNIIQQKRGKMSPDNMGRMESALKKIQADSAEFKNLETAHREKEEIDARLQEARNGQGEAKWGWAFAQRAAERDSGDDSTWNSRDFADILGEYDKLIEKVENNPGIREEYKKLKEKGELTPAEQQRFEELKSEKFNLGRLELIEKSIDDYRSLETSSRVANELYNRLEANKVRGENRATESKPYSEPKSDIENMQMLMAFWNAVNGYTAGINVNSYNIFRNIKDVRKENDLANVFNAHFAATRE